MRHLKIICILLLCVLLLGCATQEPSDEELIRQMTESGVMADWYFTDEMTVLAVVPSKGMDYLRSVSPEFDELMDRKSGTDSIRELAPEIAAEYLQMDSFEEVFKGMCLIKLVTEMHPDMDYEMRMLESQYQLPPIIESELPTSP